jgi:excisionase family DNA binding protein
MGVAAMTIERHFSIEQVAKALGKNTRTILRWIESGKIRAATLPGRFDKNSYAIPQSELERFGVSIIPDEKEEAED